MATEVTRPQSAKLGSPRDADTMSVDYSAMDPRVQQAFQSNPMVMQLLEQAFNAQQQGMLPPGFNMNVPPNGGYQPGPWGGGPPPQLPGQPPNQGGMMPGGPPSQPGGAAMPMPMNPMGSGGAGQLPMPMDPMGSQGAGAMGMGGMTGPPPPIPGMGPMPMFGMGGGAVNPLQPTPSIGAQLYGQPMSAAEPMNAAAQGMRPGGVQGARDVLEGIGRTFQADPGAWFRASAAMASGNPAVTRDWAQKEVGNRQQERMLQESLASREEIARERTQQRQDTLDTRREYQDQLFIDRVNTKAASAELQETATNRGEAEQLLQKIGTVNEAKAMDKLADSALDDELRNIRRMPARLAEFFKKNPDAHAAYQEEADRLREWLGDWDRRKKESLAKLDSLRDRMGKAGDKIPYYLKKQYESLIRRRDQLDVWKTKQNRALDWSKTVEASEEHIDDLDEAIGDFEQLLNMYEGEAPATTTPGAPAPTVTAPTTATPGKPRKSRLEELIGGATKGTVRIR